MKFVQRLYKLGALVFAMVFYCSISAQCITVFPYSQNFEANDGNWMAGGNYSEWRWGTPSKPVINSASSGVKCWTVGSLSQSAYIASLNSTLTSPCFDFSNLSSPYVRFMIFWETEKNADGVTFEYSIDGGNQWVALGTSADNIVCSINNWFNTPRTSALGVDGWSGNIQSTSTCPGSTGNGSGKWILAQHSMSNLAHRPNVIFRFRFSSGPFCNNYDGAAIDDIWIGEANVVSADFTYNCINSSEIKFQPTVSKCDGLFSWDFGDPSAGIFNQSTQYAPSHIFTKPGQYTVTLSVHNAGPVPLVHSTSINVLKVNAVVVAPLQCNGDSNGVLRADVLPAGSYSYVWNTTPVQNKATISGAKAGQYSVQVSDGKGCSVSSSVELVNPPTTSLFLGNDTTICLGQQLVLDAGKFNSYQWQDGSLGRTYVVNSSGTYAVKVVDDNGCTKIDTVNVMFNCTGLYFPSAFTPNNDGNNESFGALGNITAIKKYKLTIYNRWGQLVFQCTDPAKKWNGLFDDNSFKQTQTFIWFAEYFVNGIRKNQKGTVTVIR